MKPARTVLASVRFNSRMDFLVSLQTAPHEECLRAEFALEIGLYLPVCSLVPLESDFLVEPPTAYEAAERPHGLMNHLKQNTRN